MSTFPLTLTLNANDDAGDVIDGLFLAPFVQGDEPFAKSVYLSPLRKGARLVPDGVSAERVAIEARCTVLLARGDGWSLRVRRWRDAATVSVTATTAKAARRLVAEIVAEARAEASAAGDEVKVGFWHWNGLTGQRAERCLAVSEWQTIRRNYSASVVEAIDRLVKTGPSEVAGRLLLLHGPPGTGKTTLLRALAAAWREWCDLDYVVDPEELFASAGYLLEAAVRDDETRQRMLVLEDCDELIRADARLRSGHALGRLLNMTDGLLGQGRPLLVALTTNEALSGLHPAIVRPGRCMAQIEVGRLTAAEAREWLGRPLPAATPPGGLTLAELVAIESGTSTIETGVRAKPAGQYL